jgi:Uma2 family endonuclease
MIVMTAITPAASQKLLTYDEYLEQFLTEPPTRQPYYILDGVLTMPPSPRPVHQRIIHRLDVLLDAFERSSGAIRVFPSPLDVVIRRSPLRTRQPDILVISEARCTEAGGLDMEGPITVAPELVIEVLSPSESRGSIGEKLADFQHIGVQECWVVSPQAQSVEILALTGENIVTVAFSGLSGAVESAVFPGLKIDVADIFER